MPMLKFGDTYYQGQKRETYLVGGRAIKDAEEKEINGKEHSSVTIVGAEKSANETIFLSLEGWGKNSSIIAPIRKGDFVLAFGTLNSREHNGKTYYSINCDWVCPMPPDSALSTISKAVEKSSGNSEFIPLSNEEDLPF